MRLAVLSPYYVFADQSTNFNGYDFEFLKLFRPALYFPGWRKIHYAALWNALKKHDLNPQEFRWVTSVSDLNRHADVLVSFCGRPDLPALRPPRGFNGMKVFHVMDYVFQAKAACQSLVDGGVDFVMGYAAHDKYCTFFQRYYAHYQGKVIPVPFGFGKRFQRCTPFENRLTKCVAAGSVNPVDDPAVPNRNDLLDYITFYSSERWTHKWRYTLAENSTSLYNLMDSVLPVWPHTKNWKYDAAQLMNSYQLFANDEGLMAFPPARTYEGTAAGAAMICSSHPSYTDLGFRDGHNCIMHPAHDLQTFREKLSYYLAHPRELNQVAQTGYELVTKNYSHSQIAKSIYSQLEARYNGQRH